MTTRRQRGLLAAAIVLALGAIASLWGLRSEAFLRPGIDDLLSRLGDAAHGRFVVGSIEPAGLFGVRARGIEFFPDATEGEASSVPLLAIDSLTATPDLRALFLGNGLRLQRIHVSSPRIVVIVDSEGGGTVPWLDQIAAQLRSEPAGGATGSAGRGPFERILELGGLPEIEVAGGFLSIEDPAGRYPGMGVRVQRLAVTPDERSRDANGIATLARVEGEVELDGLGRGLVSGEIGGGDGLALSLHLLQDNDLFALLPQEWTPAAEASLSVGAVHFAWPPRVTISPISVRQLNLPLPTVDTWRLDDVWAAGIELSADRTGYWIGVRDARFTFGGLLDRSHARLSEGKFFRSWDGTRVWSDLHMTDAEDHPLTARLDRAGGGQLTTLRMEADGFDLAPILPLLAEDERLRVTAGVFRGEAMIEWMEGENAFSGYVDAGVEGLSFFSPVVSALPLEDVTASLDVEFRAWPDAQRIRVDRGTFRVGAMPLDASFDLQWNDERFALSLDAAMDPIDAQAALDSLPYGLVPVLRDFRLSGEFGFRAHFLLDTDDVESTEAEVDFDLDTLRVDQFGEGAPIPALIGDDWSWRMHNFDGSERVIGPATEEWTWMNQIPYHLHRAVLAAEDDGFWRHGGFDWRAIQRALRTNLAARRFVQGGSAISQQVVKNLFLSHDRTLSRKLQEAFLTWQLEERVPKWRILETYINICHWGPGIHGIREATLAYFGHMPRQVTLRESAFLAAILPNPALFGEQYARHIIAPSRRQKMRNILENMNRAGFIPDLTLQHHLRLVAQGNVSMTPPPVRLGLGPNILAMADPVGDDEFVRDSSPMFLP